MMLIYQLWDIFEVSENLGMSFQLPSFKVSLASSAHLKCETITNFGLKNHVIKRGLVNKTILYYKCAHHQSQIGPRIYSSALVHKQSFSRSVLTDRKRIFVFD